MAQRTGKSVEPGLLILRLVVGVVFVTHGWPKLLDGAAGTSQFFAQLGIPLPGVTAWLITLLEFFGGLALIAGLFVTLVSALFIVHMAVGIILVHLPMGWYVIGPGQGGVEFNVLLIASLLALVLTGPGRPAVDHLLARRAAAGRGDERTVSAS